MANVSHASLTGANLHEPKGVAAATVNKIYLSDGAGSGTWQKLPVQGLLNISSNGSLGDLVQVDGSGNFVLSRISHGSIYFVNLSTPYSLTYPSSYTKIAPTTVALGDSTEVTEATTSRLTYTGTEQKHVRLSAELSLTQSVGADRDVELAFYKNGSVITGSNRVVTLQSAKKSTISLLFHTTVSTNDYIEVFAKNAGASGDIDVYSFYLSLFSVNNIT